MVQQPIQHLDQLTTRFYSENLSDTEDSSGLGLYITEHLVQVLEGELHLAYENEWFYLTVRLWSLKLDIWKAKINIDWSITLVNVNA